MLKIWTVKLADAYRLDASSIDYEVPADNPDQAIKRAKRVAKRISLRECRGWTPRFPIAVKLITTTSE